MGKTNPYGMTSPCDTCPFRTDVAPYLRPDRVREIQQSLVRSEFPCHKTVDYSKVDPEDDGPHIPTGGEMHCAGALILLEKTGQPSQMMRISERLGMYDASKLDMAAPVFDSFREMVDAQRRMRKVRQS